MQVGDRVLFVADRGVTPVPGAVACCYANSCWVDVRLDDGTTVDLVLAATSHFQSPKGHYCIKDDTVTYHIPQATVETAGRALQDICHSAARAGGWWNDLATGADLTIKAPGEKLRFSVPEKLCLIHSEVSEGMEGFRKNLMDDKLPHRPMLEVELADAVIRCFDLAGGLGLDLGGALAEKLAFNASRVDHTHAARIAAGGKQF